MKKLIEEVVENEKNKKTKQTKNKYSTKKSNNEDNILTNSITRGVENRELEKVLASLTTTIKVVGCGGAGTNTIARCFWNAGAK